MKEGKQSNALSLLEDSLGEAISLGMMLRAHRTRMGMTQSELAEKLKTTKSYISDVEKGRKHVSLEKAVQFARGLGEAEAVFAEIAVKDQLGRMGLQYSVHLTALAG